MNDNRGVFCHWIELSSRSNGRRLLKELAAYQQQGASLQVNQRVMSPYGIALHLIETSIPKEYMRDYIVDETKGHLIGIHFNEI